VHPSQHRYAVGRAGGIVPSHAGRVADRDTDPGILTKKGDDQVRRLFTVDPLIRQKVEAEYRCDPLEGPFELSSSLQDDPALEVGVPRELLGKPE